MKQRSPRDSRSVTSDQKAGSLENRLGSGKPVEKLFRIGSQLSNSDHASHKA